MDHLAVGHLVAHLLVGPVAAGGLVDAGAGSAQERRQNVRWKRSFILHSQNGHKRLKAVCSSRCDSGSTERRHLAVRYSFLVHGMHSRKPYGMRRTKAQIRTCT